MTGSQIKQESPETNTFKMAGNRGRLSVKFEKHQARCTNLAAHHRRIFYVFDQATGKCRRAQLVEETTNYEKGKGTLRPTTRLNFLVAVYEKTKELLSLTLRIEEAFPNEVEVISDLNELVATVANSAK